MAVTSWISSLISRSATAAIGGEALWPTFADDGDTPHAAFLAVSAPISSQSRAIEAPGLKPNILPSLRSNRASRSALRRTPSVIARPRCATKTTPSFASASVGGLGDCCVDHRGHPSHADGPPNSRSLIQAGSSGADKSHAALRHFATLGFAFQWALLPLNPVLTLRLFRRDHDVAEPELRIPLDLIEHLALNDFAPRTEGV